MANVNKTFMIDDFIENSNGLYEATISATDHKFGTHFHMARALLKDVDNNWQNTITPYEILENGDFKIFVEEPAIYRVTIVQD